MAGAPKRLAVLLAIVGALLLVISTGAATWDPGSPIDELVNTDQETLALQPSSDYAYLDASGETTIDLTAENPDLGADGLNPDAITVIEDVALLNYTGPEYADVWVSTDAEEGVEIYADGTRIEKPENNITLESGETVGIDLRIDSSNRTAVESTTTLTVHAEGVEMGGTTEAVGGGDLTLESEESPPEPIVRILGTGPDERTVEVDFARADQPVLAQFSEFELPRDGAELRRFEFTPTEDGNLSIAVHGLTVAAAQDGTQNVETSTGLTPLVAFEIGSSEGVAAEMTATTLDVPLTSLPSGTNVDTLTAYRFDGDDWTPVETTVEQRNETLRITSAIDEPTQYVLASEVSDIDVTSATMDRDNETENVTINATVSNDGTGAGNETLAFTANGTLFTSRTVELGPGESTTVSTVRSFNVTGNTTVAVNGVEAGTLRPIESAPEQPTPEPEPTPTPEPEPTEEPTATQTSTPTETTTPSDLEEPAGVPLGRLGGLALTGGIFLTLVALIRRVPV
ncbi:MAG: DUF1102 domain-containing protein [Halodesulfurarchaeum sp.]